MFRECGSATDSVYDSEASKGVGMSKVAKVQPVGLGIDRSSTWRVAMATLYDVALALRDFEEKDEGGVK
jgi:hypothetical protein